MLEDDVVARPNYGEDVLKVSYGFNFFLDMRPVLYHSWVKDRSRRVRFAAAADRICLIFWMAADWKCSRSLLSLLHNTWRIFYPISFCPTTPLFLFIILRQCLQKAVAQPRGHALFKIYAS